MSETLSISQQVIQDYLDSKQAKLFGDRVIGYRSQLPNGEYDDEGFEKVYEELKGSEYPTQFSNDCESLKTGNHNW